MIDSKTEWFQRHAREMERRTREMERRDRKLQRGHRLKRERRYRRQRVSFPFNLLDGLLNFILMTIELKVKEIVSQTLSRKLPRP